MSLSTTASPSDKVALSPSEFRAFTVRRVEPVTHDTKRIVFDLPTPEHEMGLSVASCLLARATIDGEPVVRPYTPVNKNTELGKLELVVKGYPTGKLSKHIVGLNPGDALELKGPFSKFRYTANQFAHISFLAGGSGLTPLLQIVKQIVSDPADTTPVVLVYANRAERDILLRDELDALAAAHPQFAVHYVLSQPPVGWTGRAGHINESVVQALVPSPRDDALVCVCGPPPMMTALSGDKEPDKTQGELVGLLRDLQYTSAQVYKF